jgi:hypothetical protein
MLSCRHKPSHIQDIHRAIERIDLDDIQKEILNSRYTSVLREYEQRAHRYSLSYNGLRIMITVGSLIVPAVLSVQYTASTGTSQFASASYWCVWLLSLFVTISNGVLSLFKIDKKYYILNSTFQHLMSEGWQYIQLCGRYSGRFTPGEIATHQTQLKYFCFQIERVRMKQVEDEYYRVPDEKDTHGHGDTLLPPTPLKETLPSLNSVLQLKQPSTVVPLFSSNRKPVVTVKRNGPQKIQPIDEKNLQKPLLEENDSNSEESTSTPSEKGIADGFEHTSVSVHTKL